LSRSKIPETTDSRQPERLPGYPAALHHWTRRVDPQADALGPAHDELRTELTAEIDRLTASRTGS
jgi:hypothetical protein